MFVAILVAAVSLLAVTQCGPGTLPIALPAATMTFGVVVSGFVATQRNMLLTMSGAEVLRFAVERGYHNDVISYLMDCIRAGLLIIAISLSGFFFGDNSLLWGIWLTTMAGAVSLVICLIVRNEMLVSRMVRRFLEETNRSREQASSKSAP